VKVSLYSAEREFFLCWEKIRMAVEMDHKESSKLNCGYLRTRVILRSRDYNA
jgi:hypothetical protein